MKFKIVTIISLIYALIFSGIVFVGDSASNRPIASPVGPLVVKQRDGEKRIAAMEANALSALNAPLENLTGKDLDAVKQQRKHDYEDAQQWISIQKQVLTRELAAEQWNDSQETRLLLDESAQGWVDRMTKKFGVYPHAGTHIIFANSAPCDKPDFKSWGCVSQDVDIFGNAMGTHIDMYLSPDAIGNIYILFHEIGHTNGILDECSADKYSRNITSLEGGHYC